MGMLLRSLLVYLICVKVINAYEKVSVSQLNFNHPGSRISGGIRALPNEFPWHAYILANRPVYVSTCGGSIISESWILTAAHCTHNFLSLDLYFGSTDVYSMPEVISSTYWIEHNGYNPSNYNNDIALIQLERPLNFTTGIQPITLLSLAETDNDFVNQIAIVLGFGYMTDENPEESADLLYTQVLVVPNGNCIHHYGASVVTNNTLCAIGFGSTINSICSGDSGGAMVIKDENGNFTQIGINSFVSSSGCTTGSPSGYVRLSSYLNWIEQQLKGEIQINSWNSKLKLDRTVPRGKL